MREVVAVLLLVLLCGCGGVLDGAIRSANVAAELGDRTQKILASEYDREQQDCIDRATAKPEAVACVTAVRSRFASAWSAYRAFRWSWLALVTSIESAQAIGAAPNPATLAILLGRMATAHGMLRAAAAQMGLSSDR